MALEENLAQWRRVDTVDHDSTRRRMMPDSVGLGTVHANLLHNRLFHIATGSVQLLHNCVLRIGAPIMPSRAI